MASAATLDESYDGDDDEGGLSGFWILIIFLAVLAAFGSIVYIAYQKGLHRQGGSDLSLPVVTANPDAARTEMPLEPIGANREEVDAALNDTTPSRVVATIDPDTDPMNGFDADAALPVLPSAISIPTTGDIARAADELTTRTPVSSSASETPSQVASTQMEMIPVVKPRSSAPASAPAQAVTPPAAVSATHSVQVGAFGSRDEAMGFYGALMLKMGPFVGNERPEVRVANVKGRDYYRLWIGAFANRGEAQTYCAELSKRGQDCYVQKR